MELGVGYKDKGGTDPVGFTTSSECPPENDSDDGKMGMLSSGALLTPSWSLDLMTHIRNRHDQLCPH